MHILSIISMSCFLAVFCNLYYRVIQGKNTFDGKGNIIKYSIPAAVFAVVWFIMSIYGIIEPLRSAICVIVWFAALWITEKELPKFGAFFAAYGVSVAVLVLSLSISGMVTSPLALFTGLSENLPLWAILADVISIPINIIVYRIIKQHDGLKTDAADDGVVKTAAVFSGLIFIFVLFARQYLNVENVNLFDYIIYTALFVFIAAAVVAVLYQLKKYYERRAIDNKTLSFIQKCCKIRTFYLGDWAQKNRYADVHSAMAKWGDGIIANLENAKGIYDDKILAEISTEAEKYIYEYEHGMSKSIYQHGAEVIFNALPRKKETWGWSQIYEPIYGALDKLAKICGGNRIFIDCENSASDELWKTADTAYVEALTTNLLNSAIKELDATRTDGDKNVSVRYIEKDGVFAVEVSDNARQFPIREFVKLGRRDNEYAEIRKCLAESKASLVIDEKPSNKTMRVIFDGKGEVAALTDARYEKLKKKLTKTDVGIAVGKSNMSKVS